MPNPRPTMMGSRPGVLAGGAASAAIGVAALAGWATGNLFLMGLRDRYIPMAPNTAFGFVALGLALVALGVGGNRQRWGVLLASAGVGLIGVLRLSEFVTKVDLGVDRVFLQVPAATLGLAPVGKMAMSTSAAFLAASIALGMIAWPVRGRVASDLAGWAALLAGTAGLVFALGYLFAPNAPLLYGTGSIPMALNTALGFVALGIGLVAANGPGTFPLRRLSGPSTRARLLRVFLPLVVGATLAGAWLAYLASTLAGASLAALASAALATLALVLASPICERIADRVGERIERAEAALQRANDELEATVARRTAALRRANDELDRSFRELTEGHEALKRAHHELQQAQSRMLEQAKMASLGQTAAGVAHEINNPLACVTSNIAVLKREVGSLGELVALYRQAENTLAESQQELHAKIHEYSDEIDLPYVLENLDGLMDRSRESLRRIQKIVQDLRDFAHLDEADYQDVDVNAGIVATANVMRGLADRRGVALETELGPIPRITCYPAKISLVVQSLISNAIDACASGGRVVVATRPTGAGIAIEVADDGAGIDPLIHEKVFDPFFTTKPIGQGTGLGLSMSYGIVEDHGGTIRFDSIPGLGTRFTVVLPATPPAAPAREHRALQPLSG